MPSLRLGIWATAAYTALIAAATFYVFQISEAPADIQGALAALLPVQLIAVVFCCLVVMRYFGWRHVGFGALRWSGLIWLLPSWAVLGVIGWSLTDVLTLNDLRSLGGGFLFLLITTPLLVAFGEEVLFRGILLRGAMAQLTLPQAMALSAVLFGAFHLVNGLGDQELAGASQQVLFAVLVGFYLAPIAVRIGNLWPLIIWHWLWNIAVFLSQYAGIMHPFVLIGIAMQTVIAIWLWAELIRGSHQG
ncbi:CPBP family intramembrane metalloprotease [Yoonia sp. F2084L]|uniref:CPBP family intramembrane glutamic endopeptidase n=1 Tax=Yoonia sp. F2084L TaxID=2926419 RepID=UPI001FF60EEE|nr:CPBP family intramembrane glutamic endopeptidase [Yoonia sp. F2084L]MCK0096643.1 CPBP family intramembrane metalloprotease [Yoonia sp. F2084L]